MKPESPVRVERWLYALSAVIVATVVGATVWLDAGPGEVHPRIVSRIDGAEWRDGGLRAVPWIVENPGTWDIQAVQVEIRLGASEPVNQAIDYLPRGANGRGVALFPDGPGAPTVRVVGWRLP